MSKSDSVSKKPKKPKTIPATPSTVDPAYLQDVVKKLKKHPTYQHKLERYTEEKWKEKARKLTDPEKLHVKFSHLTDEAYADYALETGNEATDTEGGRMFTHHDERNKAGVRIKRRLDGASNLPVKLYLRTLEGQSQFSRSFASIFAKKYGALHAALQVGDIIVEWDNSSLVIPTRRDFADPIFRGDMSKHTTVSMHAAQLAPQMTDAVKHMKYNESIDLLFDVSVSRKKMIDNLISMICKYNKHLYYHMLRRNCQTFVTDAMAAMGIKDIPKFSGRLKEYFTEVKKGKEKSIPDEFRSHEQLDCYVMDIKKKDTLTAHDKEYLLCLYFQFHLQAMRADKNEPEEVVMRCPVASCQMGTLERMIDGQPVILLTFDAD